MKNKLSKITAFAFALPLIAFMLIGLILPDGDISSAERRKLKAFPSLTLNSLLSGSFMSNFESYAADQFPLREAFRTIKSGVNFYALNLRDKDGLYVYEGSIAKLTSYDAAASRAALDKFEKLRADHLENSACYIAFVPNKGSYTKGYPKYDAEALNSLASEYLGFTDIDIADTLTLDDYYKTDLHWRSDSITDTAGALLDAMGAEHDYTGVTAREIGALYGAYYGQLSLPMEADRLSILEGGYIDALEASRLNEKTFAMEAMPVFDEAALNNVDAYDVFMGGAVPLAVIENPKCQNGRTLAVFRDSFTSSIAPLLASGYERVILIDLRYIASAALIDYVDFASVTDALFLYSYESLNNQSTLLVK